MIYEYAYAYLESMKSHTKSDSVNQCVYLKNSHAKFHPDKNWHDASLAFLKSIRPTTTTTTGTTRTRKVAIQDEFLIHKGIISYQEAAKRLYKTREKNTEKTCRNVRLKKLQTEITYCRYIQVTHHCRLDNPGIHHTRWTQVRTAPCCTCISLLNRLLTKYITAFCITPHLII